MTPSPSQSRQWQTNEKVAKRDGTLFGDFGKH
jgi:hypothetical protein